MEAKRSGALDFIEKPFEDKVLIESIKRAAAELSKTAAGVDVAIINARLSLLSEREREVLSGVVAGLPNKTIGYDLNISARTVEVHRGNVMGKMEAKNLPELVRMALAVGFGPK